LLIITKFSIKNHFLLVAIRFINYIFFHIIVIFNHKYAIIVNFTLINILIHIIFILAIYFIIFCF